MQGESKGAGSKGREQGSREGAGEQGGSRVQGSRESGSRGVGAGVGEQGPGAGRREEGVFLSLQIFINVFIIYTSMQSESGGAGSKGREQGSRHGAGGEQSPGEQGNSGLLISTDIPQCVHYLHQYAG